VTGYIDTLTTVLLMTSHRHMID